MGTDAYQFTVRSMVPILGDIFSQGIVRKGLEKAGSSPETAGYEDLREAFDIHITDALASFVGSGVAAHMSRDILRQLRRDMCLPEGETA